MALNNWRLWLGIGVSSAFLLLLIWTTELDDLFRALKEANYLYVVPAVTVYFIAVYFRAARWKYILSPMRTVSVTRIYPVVVIGYAANNVLPARAGELVRAYYMAQREHLSGSAALATIGVERIYDGLTLFVITVASALVLLLLGVFGEAGDLYRNAAFALAGIAGLGLVVALLFITFIAVNPRTIQLIDRVLSVIPVRFQPRLRDLALNFIQGLGILSSPRQHGMVFLLSLPVWLGEILVYFTLAYSFGINEYFSNPGTFFLAIILVTGTSNLSTAIPLSIGGIGPFEIIAQQTLSVMGVEAAVAASYALVTHLVALWLPVNLAGLVLMWRENLSLKQLTSSDAGKDPPDEGETIRGGVKQCVSE